MGYSVVGEFITQAETAEHISEALEQLRRWNPMWNPRFFMTDYSEAELLALEQSFPDVQIYLRDFHREQAWKRWANNHKHGLSNDQKESLLSKLRECANAPPTDHGSGLPQDFYYLQAVDNLKGWLETKWLCIPKVNHVTMCLHYCFQLEHTHMYLL